ncbi:MAG: hypothetical protein RIE53_05070 [Rhodothermales bacterium]
MTKRTAWFVLLLGALGVLPVAAQVSPSFYDYTRPDLDWKTIETEHFLVHFHSDAEGTGSRTARVVAQVAEDVYGPLTDLYEYRPDTKVSIVLKDYEDYSNGAAYFFDNVIEIWAPALDTPYRGDHNWLRNVIAHEFLHMIQVQKTMKTTRRIPFLYLQVLDYEDVRRPDVLYGFPNVLATYPVPILNNPAWLAEGTAQFQREAWGDDRWDSHRDMLLRTQVAAGTELTLAEMGGFYSHTSLMRESVYNHGFAFTQYLVGRFGEDAVREISQALANTTTFTFKEAARDAFGVDGQTLYDDWMASIRPHYQELEQRTGEPAWSIVEPDGFNNFHPVVSPDGQRVAYLSNKGEDFSRTGVYVRDLDAAGNPVGAARLLGGLHVEGAAVWTCAFGHRIVQRASGPIAWTPDGSGLVYSRAKDTAKGYLYSDLFRYDFVTEESEPLTTHERADSPVYSPDGKELAFVSHFDGTTNLKVLTLATGEIRPLTTFEDGSQVTDPAWHPDGEWLWFAYGRLHGRDLYRVHAQDGRMEVMRDGPEDERSPTFDTQGRLVYVSDRSGIFNLYRTTGDSRGGSADVALTNAFGGAFMPDVAPDGRVVFSAYEADGYKIALLEEPEDREAGLDAAPPAYTAPDVFMKARVADLRPTTDDSHIRATDTGFSDYSPVFTSFSFLPVLRLDQYISRRRTRTDVVLPDRTRLETLWRNTKVGFYTGTREVLGGMSFFGGVLVSPGSTPANSFSDFWAPSNLLKVERDVFLQFDFGKGISLVPYRWSPQFSVELFNVRRNVENGLSVEEFPCTACYPATSLADLSYNLWELGFLARSKVNRALLLEAGYRYSPYRVTTERFFSQELLQSIPENSSRYFIGKSLHLTSYHEAFKAYRDMDVVPHGMRSEITLQREAGSLLDRFDLEDGFLRPVYTDDVIHRLTVDARGGFRLPGGPAVGAHGVGIRFRGSTILGGPVDDFYDDYVGGLTGARGYPFYALGGNESLWLQLGYTFPLAPRVSRQVLWLHVDKIYARVYADAATAWSGSWPGMENVRKDVGAEIRFGLGSFYLLPTAVFVSGTYGLDAFDFQLDDGFVTPDGQSSVRYGKSMQWHVGVLFGFDQL